ncbi:hypothetical protein Plhal304r1_c067g0155191 [Plasmopara halstedii]
MTDVYIPWNIVVIPLKVLSGIVTFDPSLIVRELEVHFIIWGHFQRHISLE